MVDVKAFLKPSIYLDFPTHFSRFVNVTQAALIVATRSRIRAAPIVLNATQSSAMLSVTDRLHALN
jgi:hypothetical protein